MRAACIFSVIGVAAYIMLFRLDREQSLKIKAVLEKKAAIAQIPALRARIAELGAVNGLFLSGIISDKQEPMAVINNTLVKVGDEIEDKKVAAITGQTVTVCSTERPDQCVQLLLQP